VCAAACLHRAWLRACMRLHMDLSVCVCVARVCVLRVFVCVCVRARARACISHKCMHVCM